MTVNLISITPDAEKTMAHIARVSNPDNQDNPEWDKDWQAGVAASQEMFKWTGEARSSGWNEVLDRASRQPGSTVRKNRDYSF